MASYSEIKARVKKYGVASAESTSEDDKSENNSGREYSDSYKKIKDKVQKHGITYTVDADFIKTFVTDASTFLSTAKEDFDKIGWSNASLYYDMRSERSRELASKAREIEIWLESNKGKLERDSYDSIKKMLDNYRGGSYSVMDAFGGAKDYYAQWSSEKAYNDYKTKQDRITELTSANDLEDFEQYSQIGASIKNPTPSEAEPDVIIFGKGFGGEAVGNIVTYSREHADKIAMGEGNGGGSYTGAKSLYKFMTDEEVAIYNYYLGKGDKKTAGEYLAALDETLNQRHAGLIADNVAGNRFLELLTGVGAGLDNFAYGIRNIDNLITGSDPDAPTVGMMAGSMVGENMEGGWGVAYDAATAVGNMLPSVIVGTFTGGAGGAITMGASAVGNGYAEMKNLGYGEWESRGYGLLVGASEASLQYVLGGVSKLGGKVSGNAVNKFVSGFDNAIARTAIKLGGNMASEGLEEAIQTALEPAYKALMTGEDFEAAEWGDIMYSFLLGALTAGVMEGAPTIAGTAINSHNANKLYGSNPQAFVSESLEIDPDNAHAQRMQTRLDNGKSVSGYQLNRLAEANESALYKQDTAKLKKSILQKLGEYGETTDVTPVAEVLIKYAKGEKLSPSDIKILNNSDTGHRVMAELNKENIASGSLDNNWAESIGTKRISPESYNKDLYNLAKQAAGVREAVEKGSVAKTLEENKNTTDSKFKASESGKTIYVDKNGDGVEVAVKKVVSTEGGLKVELDNGKTVSASDLRFSTSEEALMYEMVARMEVTPETANEIIHGFKPANVNQASQYFANIPLAYQYGKIGYEAGLNNINLTKQEKEIAYKRGRADAMAKAESQSKASPKNANPNKETTTPKSGIIFEDGVTYDESTANELQKKSMIGIEVIDKMSNLEVHVFESKVVNGKRVAYVNGKLVKAPNGYFKDGNKIYIDLNAGNGGEGAMLYTMSHEGTHYIRKWNEKGFKELGDFLIEQYSKKGVPVNALLEAQKDKIKQRYTEEGKTLPGEAKLADMAYEELVADAMSDMFADPKAYEKLAKLKQQNKSLWKKLGEAIKSLLNKLKTALGIYKTKNVAVAQEAVFVRGFSADVYEKLQDLYIKAFVKADANYATAEKTLYDNGIAVDPDTESASIMSVRDVLSDEQRQKVSVALATRFGVSQTEALDWLKAETSMASLILNPKYSQYLDYIADENEEAIKSNSDYPRGTVDFSNICKKRRDFTEVMNRVLRNFPNHVFEATDLAKIRTIMSEEGMEVACGICYVEDRRQLDSIVAQDFINSLDLYRNGSKTRPDGKAFNANQLKALKLIDGDTYVPSIYELISLEGRNSLKAKNPAMEEAWVKFNNARGMQSVRLLLNDAEYKRQILKYTPAVVKRKNDLGGLRIYSFSDMEMFHLIDIIQVITDSATVGLSLQGYTKVNEYARAVKDTGEKLNRSLIPKGDLGYHMEDGKVVLDFDTVEGIDVNHPDFFDNIDNPNIGNIVIGINATQIRAAMTSKFIDQIIPFHTGQSNEVLGEKGIATWANYKDFQSERDLATGKKSTHQINIYTEVIQAAEKEGKTITNKVEFVNKFLEVCKENNLEPRFSEFLNVDENGNYTYAEGYHKFLVDFKTFDQNTGEYLPQMPVKPFFDNEYITTLLKDYVKSQKKKDAAFAKSMPKVLDRITNEIVNSENNDTQYSVREIVGDSGKSYGTGVYLDSTLLTDLTEEERVEMVKEYVKELGGSVFTAYDNKHNAVDVHIVESNRRFKNKGGKNVPVYKHMLGYLKNEIKQEAIALVDELITTSTYSGIETSTHPHGWVDNNGANDWESWTTYLQDKENTVWEATLKIANSANGEKILYEIHPIKMVEQSGKPDTSTTKDSISHPEKNVNSEFSEADEMRSDRDSLGNELSEEQQEYFKDSKVRDKKGNLMVLYHGTTANFNTFKKGDVGFHFGTKGAARGRAGFGKNVTLKEVYLNITNPIVFDEDLGSWDADYRLTRELYDKGILTQAEAESVLFSDDRSYRRTTEAANKKLASVLLEKGYDGIEYSNTFETKKATTSYIVFNSNQAKETTNKAPTGNPDIRYADRGPNAVSNRTLLANALESTVTAGEERNILRNYKTSLRIIEEEQRKLDKIRSETDEIKFKKSLSLDGEKLSVAEFEKKAKTLAKQQGKSVDEVKFTLSRDSASYTASIKGEVILVADKEFRSKEDMEKLQSLYQEARKVAARINAYDKELLRLETMKPIKNVLNREKAMLRKRLEQKGKEAIKAQKEKDAATVRELMTRHTESRKNAVESRNKTAMKHKIKDIVSDLNKLLLNPTKEQHVPIGLQKVVAEALDAINMDSMNAEERVAYYNDLISKSSDPDEIAMLTKKRDFFEYRDANFKERITALKNAYAEFKESDDPLIRNAHNEAIENLIKNIADEVGNKSLKDMSLAQLEAVYDMYKAILATVRNSNKMFKEGRQATITENSEAVKTEVKEVGGHHDRIRKLTKGIKSFTWNLLKPIYALQRIGSKTLTGLYENVRAGEETYAVDIYEAKGFFQDKSKKYNYDSWDFKKRFSFKDSAGNEFSLSLEQIMSLYAYSKREQADKHLEFGGFVFDDSIEVTEKNKLGIPVKYEVNDATPYRLRVEDLTSVTSTLTADQKAFVDDMQTYLSDVMGAKGNEISLAMYDIKMFKEKYYFPLKTSRYFREYNPEQTGNPMLRNSGFTKKTVPQAGNPIVLSNFMEVWTSHVNDMSMYHSFVLPLEDFMRVYNYSSTAGGYDSVQQYIKNAYGAEANQYIEKLMQDINGGVISGNLQNGMLKMFSKFKKAAVAASLSTMVQQPTAVIRAMAIINPKYFAGIPFKGGHKKTWEELKKYAPVAIIKEMGGFDVGSGRQAKDFITSRDYKGLGKIKGFFTDSSYRDSVFMWGATKADEIGWNSIWRAVKREVASKQNLKPGTEEFFKACGKRFTEVVTQTQVYDSVFSRSGIMRDKGDLNKFATSFMGEPTTSFNMIYNAILKAKRGGSKAQSAREISSVYVSIISAAAMASLVYALRDDDEDEAYFEKWAEAFGNKLSSEIWIHNMIPYIRDIASILEGWDVERPDMSIFSDIKSSFDQLFKVNDEGEFEWKVDFSDPKAVYSAIENFGGSIASAFGLPLKNLMRDTRGILNGFKAMFDDIHPTDVGGAFVEGFTGEEKDKSDSLYEAIINGDEGRLKIYRAGYKTEESYETAVRKALRENDSRIKEAAQARYDGDIAEYTRIAREIIAEGNFSQDTVVGAINYEITAIKKGETAEDEPTEDKDEATSIYKTSDINAAFESGDNSTALKIIDDLIKTKVANGNTEKEAKSSLRSSMTSYWKPLYKEAYQSGNSSEMARIRKILYSSNLYGSSNDVVKTCQNWLKD